MVLYNVNFWSHMLLWVWKMFGNDYYFLTSSKTKIDNPPNFNFDPMQANQTLLKLITLCWCQISTDCSIAYCFLSKRIYIDSHMYGTTVTLNHTSILVKPVSLHFWRLNFINHHHISKTDSKIVRKASLLKP